MYSPSRLLFALFLSFAPLFRFFFSFTFFLFPALLPLFPFSCSPRLFPLPSFFSAHFPFFSVFSAHLSSTPFRPFLLPTPFAPNFLCSVFSAHLSSTLFPSLYSLAPFIHYASRGFRFFFFQFFIAFPASPARFVPPPYASSHIFLSSFCPFMLLLSSLLPRIDIFSVDRPL